MKHLFTLFFIGAFISFLTIGCESTTSSTNENNNDTTQTDTTDTTDSSENIDSIVYEDTNYFLKDYQGLWVVKEAALIDIDYFDSQRLDSTKQWFSATWEEQEPRFYSSTESYDSAGNVLSNGSTSARLSRVGKLVIQIDRDTLITIDDSDPIYESTIGYIDFVTDPSSSLYVRRNRSTYFFFDSTETLQPFPVADEDSSTPGRELGRIRLKFPQNSVFTIHNEDTITIIDTTYAVYSKDSLGNILNIHYQVEAPEKNGYWTQTISIETLIRYETRFN